ncbi:MAG: hypothetical protein HY541_04125 [Deltaproteobacteria bacterium]|nr:hypothetical protein [Deltaproteobacteria bacterium]
MSFINISRGPGRRIQFDSEPLKAPKPKTTESSPSDSFRLARNDAVYRYQNIIKPAGPSDDTSLADLDQLLGPKSGIASHKSNRRA